MSDKQKDVIITIQVSPVSGGKRKILISGAPEQEMPIVRAGVFADMNRLLGEVWLELQKRKPQIVKVKAEKPETKPTAKTADKSKSAAETSTEPGDQLVAEETDQAPDPVEKALDDAGANLEPEIPDPEEPNEEQLPLIEGDTTNG